MVKTVERFLGLVDDTDFTCPFIDEAIEKVRDGLNDLVKAIVDTDDNEEIEEDRIWKIIKDLSYVEKDLEDLRQRNIDIRNWGQKWKEKAIELYDKHEHQMYMKIIKCQNI